MKPEIEPLPPEVARLLTRGTAPVQPPEHVRARLRQRLESRIGAPVPAAGPAVSRWTRVQGLAEAAAGSRVLVGLAGFLAGAATVFALRSAPPPAPAVAVAAPGATQVAQQALPIPRPAPSIAQEAVRVAPPVVASPSIVHRRAPARPASQVAAVERPALAPLAVQSTPVAPPRAHWGLEAEGELLQKGRTAMVRGDAEGALAAVEEHATRFPQGRLAEEREALRIQALVAEDRDPEARTALGAFEHAYPNSLLGPALEEAVIGRFNDGSSKSTQSSQ